MSCGQMGFLSFLFLSFSLMKGKLSIKLMSPFTSINPPTMKISYIVVSLPLCTNLPAQPCSILLQSIPFFASCIVSEAYCRNNLPGHFIGEGVYVYANRLLFKSETSNSTFQCMKAVGCVASVRWEHISTPTHLLTHIAALIATLRSTK